MADCKYCHEYIEWEKDDEDRWRAFNEDGSRHNCGGARAQAARPRQVTRQPASNDVMLAHAMGELALAMNRLAAALEDVHGVEFADSKTPPLG